MADRKQVEDGSVRSGQWGEEGLGHWVPHLLDRPQLTLDLPCSTVLTAFFSPRCRQGWGRRGGGQVSGLPYGEEWDGVGHILWRELSVPPPTVQPSLCPLP